MARPKKYSTELRERAVRMCLESERPIAHVARDLEIHPESAASASAWRTHVFREGAPAVLQVFRADCSSTSR